MYIPTWLLWVLFYVIAFGLAYRLGRSQGDYDFASPLIGAGIVFVSVAFGIGYALSSWLG